MVHSIYGYALVYSVDAYNHANLTPAKVVGLVPAGTHYTTDASSVYFLWSNMGTDATYTITSGPFKGITARGLDDEL